MTNMITNDQLPFEMINGNAVFSLGRLCRLIKEHAVNLALAKASFDEGW